MKFYREKTIPIQPKMTHHHGLRGRSDRTVWSTISEISMPRRIARPLPTCTFGEAKPSKYYRAPVNKTAQDALQPEPNGAAVSLRRIKTKRHVEILVLHSSRTRQRILAAKRNENSFNGAEVKETRVQRCGGLTSSRKGCSMSSKYPPFAPYSCVRDGEV